MSEDFTFPPFEDGTLVRAEMRQQRTIWAEGTVTRWDPAHVSIMTTAVGGTTMFRPDQLLVFYPSGWDVMPIDGQTWVTEEEE